MNKLRTTLLLLLVSVVSMALAQVNVTVEQKRVNKSEIDLIFHAEIEKGWHVYGTNIASGGPTAAVFKVDQGKGATVMGKLKELRKAKEKYDEMFEMNVSYFEGKATFVQRVKLTQKDYSLKGYLLYGACNDENCLPPTSVDVLVKGTDGPEKFDAKGKNHATGENAAGSKSGADGSPSGVVGSKSGSDGAPSGVVGSKSGVVGAPSGVVGSKSASDGAPSALANGGSATNQTNVGDSSDKSAVANAFGASAEKGVMEEWYAPVVDELHAMGEAAAPQNKTLAYIFLLGFIGGFIALLTPCVWPIIPMTVSFFLHRSDNKRRATRDAIIYGVSIIVIYVSLGIIITSLFGANALNDLSTNAYFNILFFLMLVLFAASFLGGFEITLPSKWTNSVDEKANSATGLLSIFLMAFTLTLVSFSCTGPIIGFLLVEVSTSGGSALAPTVGMFGFALALALPFTLFALFPSWLKKAPKSGGWMNTIKVVLGFVELAFALKFLSVADLAYGWHILDREVFLSLWICLFFLLAAYLFGWIKFPHDDADERNISVSRFFIGLISFAFSIYMLPGLWGAPVKAVSAFAPPLSTQDFNLDPVKIEPAFTNYEQGMAYARKVGKPVLLDFTGHGCVNCRKMELAVWHDPTVRDLLTKDYVLISLYVDEKQPLSHPITVTENGEQRTLRTIGDKWSYLQRHRFGINSQPFYLPLSPEGKPLNHSFAFNPDIKAYTQFLKEGISNYRQQKSPRQ